MVQRGLHLTASHVHRARVSAANLTALTSPVSGKLPGM